MRISLESLSFPNLPNSPLIPKAKSLYIHLIYNSILNGLPMIIYLLSIFIIFGINIHYIGKQNDINLLDAIGFGGTLFNCTVICITMSLNNGLIAICSQAFGAKNYKLVGYYFHKGVIINVIMYMICFVLLYFSSFIVKLIGMSSIAQTYIHNLVIYSLPGLFAFCLFDTTKAYLMSNQIYIPQLIVQFIITALHWLWAYIFIDYLDQKAIGAGISLTITYIFGLILLGGYMLMSKRTKESLFWFDKDSFKRILSLFKIELINGSLTYLEWIAYEIAVFFSSAYGADQMGGQIILYNIVCIIYTIPLGYSTAFNQSIGEYTGAKDKDKVKKLLHVAIGITILMIIIVEPILCFFNRYIIEFFTNHQAVINISQEATFIYCIILPAEYIQCLLGAYIRGIGREKSASICFFICYYLIGLTLAYVFGSILNGYTKGLWIGLGIGICCMCLVSAIIALRTDIEYQFDFIEKRLGEDKAISSNNERLGENKVLLNSNNKANIEKKTINYSMNENERKGIIQLTY